MSHTINIEEVRAKAREIVLKADADGALQELTPRLVRQKIEEQLSLESGVLDGTDYKSVVKAALTAALEEIEPVSDEPITNDIAPEVKTELSSKRKSPEDAEEAPAKKPKTTRKKAEPKEKAKPGPKANQNKKVSKVKAKPESKTGAKKNKAVRSPSVIESSDEDEPSGKSPTKTKMSSTKRSPTKKVPGSDEKPRKRQKKVVVDSGEEAEQEESAAPSSATKKVARAKEETPSPRSKKSQRDASQNSESEMSVLIDEPPKRRQKKKKDEDSKPSKRKSKAKTDDLSQNEQEIKRLKSFVSACGVRKVWARVLQDMSEREQIQRLKQILAELGMTGRLSLEKAKAIKAERELAQELADVQQFEKSMNNGPATSSRRSRSEADPAEPSDGESDLEAPPKKRKPNARQSINAFLDDQSDDE